MCTKCVSARTLAFGRKAPICEPFRLGGVNCRDYKIGEQKQIAARAAEPLKVTADGGFSQAAVRVKRTFTSYKCKTVAIYV